MAKTFHGNSKNTRRDEDGEDLVQGVATAAGLSLIHAEGIFGRSFRASGGRQPAQGQNVVTGC